MLMLKKRVVKKQEFQSQAQTREPAPQWLIHASSHQNEIRLLAYRKWKEAGCPNGDGLRFWLAAEKEILYGRAGGVCLY